MSTSPAQARPLFGSPLKLASVIAALLLVLLALGQASRVFTDIQDRERQVGELLAAADREQRARRFHEAWASLSDAGAVVREAGLAWRLTGRATRQERLVQTAREDAAMAWLQTWQPRRRELPVQDIGHDASKEGGLLSVELAVVPALREGIGRATGPRKADLLAHLGWQAERERRFDEAGDAQETSGASELFRQALEIDPSNPYAHAYWGSLLAVDLKRLPEARSRFEAALASGRERPFVRTIQLAALREVWTRAAEIAYVDAVADMVRNREPVDDGIRGEVQFLYQLRLAGDTATAALDAAVPPPEQIALLRALFIDAPDRRADPNALSWVARLQESAGDADAALETWRSVLAALPADATGPVADRARAAIAAGAPALLR